MKVIVVWQEIPEKFGQFLVFDLPLNDPLIDKFLRFHNHYVHEGINVEIENEISKFFYTPDGNFKYTKNIVEGPVYLNETNATVVHCGFIM